MATWKIVSTTQANKGNSGDNQIVSAEFKVGHTVGGVTGWRKFRLDIPDTKGSFIAIDKVTESQVIAWVKGTLDDTLSHPTVAWCEEKAKEEYNRVKAAKDKETLALSQNVKVWE